MVKGIGNVDETEIRYIHNMQKSGLPWSKIQEIIGRSSSTVNMYIDGKPKGWAAKKPGAPTSITAKTYSNLNKARLHLQKSAGAQKEVSIAMIKEKAGVSASDRIHLNDTFVEAVVGTAVGQL